MIYGHGGYLFFLTSSSSMWYFLSIIKTYFFTFYFILFLTFITDTRLNEKHVERIWVFYTLVYDQKNGIITTNNNRNVICLVFFLLITKWWMQKIKIYKNAFSLTKVSSLHIFVSYVCLLWNSRWPEKCSSSLYLRVDY